MAVLDPTNTTANDIATEALREAGAIGVGQSPLAGDLVGAQARLQWMLQEWERKRWHVYHEVQIIINSSGKQSYTVGPGGDFDTGLGSARPDGIEAAFLRQNINPNPIDYWLERLESMEDYFKLPLKSLVSFTGAFFYDSAWPLGFFFPYPVAQANIYSLGIAVKEQLPQSFATSAAKFNIPYEYYWAMITNLAVRLRPKYGILSGPGDLLPGIAKEALKAVTAVNVQIPRLQMPKSLNRPGQYNIFSDRTY